MSPTDLPQRSTAARPRPAARRSPLAVPPSAVVAGELAAEREVRRLRVLLEHVADAIDAALDGSTSEAGDILAELSDELRQEIAA